MEFLVFILLIGQWSVGQWSVHLVGCCLVGDRWLVVGSYFENLAIDEKYVNKRDQLSMHQTNVRLQNNVLRKKIIRTL